MAIALAGLRLSLAGTPAGSLGAAAWQLASALALELAGQVTTGAVVSVTVKVVVQVPMLPAPSVAVTVIVCGPSPSRSAERREGQEASASAGLHCALNGQPTRRLAP